MNALRLLSLGAVLCLAAPLASAEEINNCRDAKGRTILTDRPCNIAQVDRATDRRDGGRDVGSPIDRLEAKDIFLARKKILEDSKPMPPETATPQPGRPLPDTY